MRRARVLCVLALGLASFASAEPPVGEYVIAVGADDGLVLPSVSQETCTPTSDGELCLALDLDTSPAGVVSGSALLTLDGDPYSFEVTFAVEGHTAGSTLKPKLALDFTGTGTAFVAQPPDPNDPNTPVPPDEFDIDGSASMSCKLNLETLDTLLCKGRARLCLFDDEGVKRGCDRPRLVTELEIEGTPFEIRLDLATSESGEVTGDGAVVIDATPVFPYNAAGRHEPSSDTTNLKLTSVDPTVKTYVKLKKTVLGGGGAAGGVVLFKIAGQKGRVALPATTTFKGHGTCIRGGFCDVNEDTDGLFTNPSTPAPLDDTIYFPILTSR